ncbi:MAG: hypothetical protein HYS38_07540 [Acidobacteria bacterium]|nr:hypothetical protein [Acidobacteriota bacterium]
MNKRHIGVRLVALVMLGSGLVNLYSLMGRDLPERIRLLREVFPLEFLHFSRFLTLLAVSRSGTTLAALRHQIRTRRVP